MQGERGSEFQRAELRHLLSDQICFSRSINSAFISVFLLIAMPSVRLLRGVLSRKRKHLGLARKKMMENSTKACRLLALRSPGQSKKCRLRRLKRSRLASFQDDLDFAFVTFKFRIAQEIFLRHPKFALFVLSCRTRVR